MLLHQSGWKILFLFVPWSNIHIYRMCQTRGPRAKSGPSNHFNVAHQSFSYVWSGCVLERFKCSGHILNVCNIAANSTVSSVLDCSRNVDPFPPKTKPGFYIPASWLWHPCSVWEVHFTTGLIIGICNIFVTKRSILDFELLFQILKAPPAGLTCSCSSSSVGCLASGAGVWVGLWVRMSFCSPYTDWNDNKEQWTTVDKKDHKEVTVVHVGHMGHVGHVGHVCLLRPYLPGFVGVFHSGRLLYVNFCCVHTSRLREKWGGGNRGALIQLKFPFLKQHNPSSPHFHLPLLEVQTGEGAVLLPLYDFQRTKSNMFFWSVKSICEVSRTMCQMLLN